MSELNLAGAIQHQATRLNEAPAWSKGVIWYQIFAERFYNGDKSNDPRDSNINIPPLKHIAPPNWKISCWTGDWYGKEEWESDMVFNDSVEYRRYGGDLQGVFDKLDYLQDLGVTALYMNPLNDASSSHKYDARSYHHIDVNFGPDPEGDNHMIESETPDDPLTWQWTSADKLFLSLIQEVHQRGMRIIMDYSWNHTGVMFWAWQDVLKHQADSKFKDWYEINAFNDPASPDETLDYNGWMGVKSLPELKKVNVSGERVTGQPYEGDINEGAKRHIFSVAERWLAPGGDASKGIDGFRLDVADQIGLGFWRDFRKAVRKINPDAYILGEIWWEDWPEKFMDPVPYTQGDIFDAIMLYHVYRPARYFFADTDHRIDAAQFKDALEFEWNRLPEDKRYAMLNVSSSHDTPRLLTDFFNRNKYKFNATPKEDPLYRSGKPDPETYQRVRLYLVHLFTSIGAPHIWNGEEMGMWGGDDPDPRKPLWWPEYEFKDESVNNYQPGLSQYDPVGFNQEQFDFYKKIIAIRKNNPVLAHGGIKFIRAHEGQLAYSRFDDHNEIIVCFNLENTSRDFDMPAGMHYTELLTNGAIQDDFIPLHPLSAAIIKVEQA